jgi:hypothetical protein
MAALTVHAGRRTYAVGTDTTLVLQAIIEGRAVDEVTGRRPTGELELRVSTPGAVVKVMPNGAFGASADIERILPDHELSAHVVDLVLECDGYGPATMAVTVPAASALPVQVGDVALRPLPVRVQGRVVRSSTDTTPAPDARVRLIDTPGQHLASLRSPLSGVHAIGTPVRVRDLSPSGASRALARAAEPGDDVLRLDAVAGLVQGTLLALDWPRRQEYARVTAVAGGDSTVTLARLLARGYAVGTEVRAVTLGVPAPPPTATLARDVDAGDGLILLDAGLPSSAIDVEIGPSGAASAEYRRVGAHADAGGFYALHGVGGVETVSVVAHDPGSAAQGPVVAHALRYGRGPNIVNPQLAP